MIFQRIVNGNKERKLLDQEYTHINEVAYIIEELIESTGVADSFEARERAKSFAESIVKYDALTDETRVDAFADIIVYATGAIAKMGYEPESVMIEVLKEIESRKGEWKKGKGVREKSVEYKAQINKCKINHE